MDIKKTSPSKRFQTEVDQDLQRLSTKPKRKLCPYGQKCFRKNPNHLKEFYHENNSPSSSMVVINSNRIQRSTLKPPTPTIKGSPKQNQTTLNSYFKRRKLDLDQEDEPEKTKNNCSSKNERKSENCRCESNRVFIENKSVITAKQTKNNSHKNNIGNDKSNTKKKIEQIETDSDENNSNIKFSRKKETSPKKASTLFKLNNLNDLMPNIDKILNNDDHLNDSQGLMKIPSSSSESELFQAKESPKKSSEPDKKKCKELHKQLFLTPLPEEVFLFWEFCKQILPKKPEHAFLDTMGLRLVGPFDILNGNLNEKHIGNERILCHWRFLFDVPEFQTIAIVDPEESMKLNHISNEYHLGYFRDEPDDDTPLIVSNDAKKTNCQIKGEADNIFAAFFLHLNNKKLKSTDFEFNKKVDKLRNELKMFAAKQKIDLKSCEKLFERQKKINSPTLNRFGILVPVVNDVGYRELPQTDQNIQKIFQRIIKLDNDDRRRNSSAVKEIYQIINLINYANDEKDFGMGLEFGLDLFSTGHPFFHRSSEHLLCKAYNFLERDAFAEIIKSHLQNRSRKYPELSA